MAKRGITDHSNGGFFGGLYGTDDSALDWNLMAAVLPPHRGPDLVSVVPIRSLDGVSEGWSSGPEAAAAGGKKGGGGGTTSGGTTSGSGSGTTTSPTPDKYPAITLIGHLLNPPSGDSTLPTDALFVKEWNLTSSSAGIDVVKAWQNYTGVGIKVGIIDDGIDYNHPDLNPHYLFQLDYDAVSATNSAYGNPSTDSHGTTVAGVLAAARDGTGIVGVAYDVSIAGFRISYSTGSPAQLADALNHVTANGMDVANASWGYSTPYQDNFFSSWSSSKAAIQNAVANGRSGLGINIVFAAGNNRPSGDNVNYHNYQNDPYVITVGATDDHGFIAPFSTPGAALLVSAPGSLDTTDDRLGSAGWSSGDYMTVAGTSYAAPTVSGIVALMLEANPDLGFRDVQEILAYSAKQTDRIDASWMTNGAHDWNGGGLHFSHDFGFGLVDATAAVRLAESWQKQSTYADMSVQTVSHTDNAKIPDGLGSLQSVISLGSSERLDKVVVDLNITHPHVSDLTITLTSPSGTTAILAAHPASGTGGGIAFETTANNFWGEDAKGDWTLTVTDSVAGNVGTLSGWTLQALGDAPSTPTTYVYTDEFANATGVSRLILNDGSGTATINTAAVTTDSYLDLHSDAVDTIAGKSLQIGQTRSSKMCGQAMATTSSSRMILATRYRPVAAMTRSSAEGALISSPAVLAATSSYSNTRHLRQT
jgi:subtilisin-like proprotein convertase family protein/subtilisin family serine protease